MSFLSRFYTLASLLLVLFAVSSSALVITGGGNITNLSITNAPVTGGALNITGGGYYYFAKASGQSTPAGGFINYTNESTDTSISIETANVTIDCMYPSLTGGIIAGPRGNDANNPAAVSAGIVVNATRATGTAISNITIRNCIFTNFSSQSSAAVLVIGNVSGFTFYNNTINNSRHGVLFATNGTSDAGLGLFTEVNLSTNTFYNITANNGTFVAGIPRAPSYAVSIRPLVVGVGSNAVSFVNSTIEYNNFTALQGYSGADASVYLSNVSNLTVFNNSVYNSWNGFLFWGINNSNVSNNNVSSTYQVGGTRYGGISIINTTVGGSSGDISGLPNTVAYNYIMNMSMGIQRPIGIFTNSSNGNYTGNTVNYSEFGITVGHPNFGDSPGGNFNKFVNNTIGNISNFGFVIINSVNNSYISNTIRDTQTGFYILGSNYTTLIGNNLTNDQSGLVLQQAHHISSQDDFFFPIWNTTFFVTTSANISAVNLSANLSNLSYSAVSLVNVTVKVPVNFTTYHWRDNSLLSGVTITPSGLTIGNLTSGTSDGSGSLKLNITAYEAYASASSVLAYNYTPHTFTASLSGYLGNSTSSTLPLGVHAAEQAFTLYLTRILQSTTSSSSSGGSTTGSSNQTQNQTTVNSTVNTSISNSTISNGTVNGSAVVGSSRNIADAGVANSNVSTSLNTSILQSPFGNLQLPAGISNVDPLLAVAALVVVVLILLYLFGLI